MIRTALVLLAVALAAPPRLRADDGAPAPVRWPQLSSGPLQDNSFLVEEAYNQEAGVVQHIATAEWDRKSRTWLGTFTQEWPVPDARHQLSFTVPYAWLGGAAPNGPGDVLLNYRYQLFTEGRNVPAVAPRLSLVLPTGSVRDGLGRGSTGVQALVPVSKQMGSHWAAHLDVGTTIVPDGRAAGVHGTERLVSWLGGGSLIWEPANAINVLAELIGTRDADVGPRGGVEHTNTLTFDPGVRLGWNVPHGVQIVTGLGVPVGLTRHTNPFGVFLYFSVEHAVTAAAAAARW